VAESQPLTDDELAQIEERAEKATPGPWYVRFLDDSHAASLVAVSTMPDTGKGERLLEGLPELAEISSTLVAATLVQYPLRYVHIADKRWHENADFIANARVDLVGLLNQIKRLRRNESPKKPAGHELAQIEARAEKATPGPWYVRFLDDSHAASLIAVSTTPDTDKGERLLEGLPELAEISPTLVAATIVQYPLRYVDIADQRWDENAEFIANARVDVVRLLNEIKRLRRA
jgi:hypothetical protein